VSKEEFSQRKFRAMKSSVEEECDECGQRIPSRNVYFERIEKGHYGDRSSLAGGKRVKHIDEETILCKVCVDVEDVCEKDKKILEEERKI